MKPFLRKSVSKKIGNNLEKREMFDTHRHTQKQVTKTKKGSN
jgi:hypothetical protein